MKYDGNMKVFISWSGERASRAVAASLRNWLPSVIQSVKPWMSDKDIYSGQRWNEAINGQLSEINFGIICVTPENQAAPWLNFEAGALAKVLESSRVIPYLHDLEKSNLNRGPITQFQAEYADKKGTKSLVDSINHMNPSPLSDEVLKKTFDGLWPQLELELSQIPQPTKVSSLPQRTMDDKVDELLQFIREISINPILQDSFVSTIRSLAPANLHAQIKERSWYEVKQRADAQLKAFLMPIQENVDDKKQR